jgi:hypothetical protein
MIAGDAGNPRRARSSAEWAKRRHRAMQESTMRRFLSLLAVAAIAVTSSAVSFAPAQAAAPRLMPAAATTAEYAGAIEQIRHRRRHHEGWREGGWHDDRWRHRRHRRYGRHFHPQPFYFGFPFAFAQPYYPYHRGRNCFRTWDGQLICR